MNLVNSAYDLSVLSFGAVLLGLFIWIGICLHLAYARMDEMLERLKNCSAVMNRAPLRHAGPWGKLLLVGGISGIVTFPGIYLKHGGVSIEDLNSFPAPLKKKLAVLQWGVILLLAAMFVSVAAIKITKAYNV
ncbi:hypothetical protein [Pseudomonas sp. PDM25]|jgi:hypothetical protein|uniref:hypothetical protein n=1 Tax=Pseudomonas sp. PDM25 TaxID=2854772 RepID=UPI001C47468C|nr:hypothetical protein [Pseudomonas sp. PDM25]MBV7512915.1 hypothetical protein [Pseudomonas sp. PDM25]